jgi:hypothetical protein
MVLHYFLICLVNVIHAKFDLLCNLKMKKFENNMRLGFGRMID